MIVHIGTKNCLMKESIWDTDLPLGPVKPKNAPQGARGGSLNFGVTNFDL